MGITTNGFGPFWETANNGILCLTSRAGIYLCP
jgi:hypothetical protein